MSTSAPASPLKAARRSLEAKAQAIRRNMSAEQLSKKAKEVRDLFKMPVTIRLLDRIAFVAGVMLVCATEYFVLVRPHEMHIFWVSLLVPLLLHRWVEFHAAKWHYFLLDFCYFVQTLLLLYLYKYSYNAYFFQLVFCLSSGPLALAVIPWKNSLVFHDWGRVTSVFIHVFPPIVTFCLRWYAAPTHAVCVDQDCSISWYTSLLWPLVFYSFWQLAYLLKTELIDADKMKKDKELVTSLRWMTDFKPHPIYKAARKRGYTGSAVFVLVAFQFLYTFVTLAPTYFFYKYYWANAGALLVVVFTTVWNGASFYFEVFAERYAKEIQKQDDKKGKILPSSWSSFFLTLVFLACFLGSLVGLLALFSAYHRV